MPCPPGCLPVHELMFPSASAVHKSFVPSVFAVLMTGLFVCCAWFIVYYVCAWFVCLDCLLHLRLLCLCLFSLLCLRLLCLYLGFLLYLRLLYLCLVCLLRLRLLCLYLKLSALSLFGYICTCFVRSVCVCYACINVIPIFSNIVVLVDTYSYSKKTKIRSVEPNN